MKKLNVPRIIQKATRNWSTKDWINWLNLCKQIDLKVKKI